MNCVKFLCNACGKSSQMLMYWWTREPWIESVVQLLNSTDLCWVLTASTFVQMFGVIFKNSFWWLVTMYESLCLCINLFILFFQVMIPCLCAVLKKKCIESVVMCTNYVDSNEMIEIHWWWVTNAIPLTMGRQIVMHLEQSLENKFFVHLRHVLTTA